MRKTTSSTGVKIQSLDDNDQVAGINKIVDPDESACDELEKNFLNGESTNQKTSDEPETKQASLYDNNQANE